MHIDIRRVVVNETNQCVTFLNSEIFWNLKAVMRRLVHGKC